MVSIITIICSFFICLFSIFQNQSEKLKKTGFFKLSYGNWIIIILALIICISSSYDSYQKNIIEKNVKKLEKEKITLMSYRGTDAIEPALTFIISYLKLNGKKNLINVFQRDVEDEPGKNRPIPSVLDSVMLVFASVSLFKPSNMYSDGKQLNWLGSLISNLEKCYHESDLLLQHYGHLNHPLVNVIDELRTRSEFLLFLATTVSQRNDFAQIWKNGISMDQHLDFFRHFYLRILKAQRLIREITLASPCANPGIIEVIDNL